MQSVIFEYVDPSLRRLAAELVLPEFEKRSAHTGQVDQPAEIASLVDARLRKLLPAILPGSRVISAASYRGGAQPRPAELGAGEVWLINPLDGARNFLAGLPLFAISVALLRNGEPIAAWMHDPLQGVMTVAEHGAGAYLEGRRLEIAHSAPGISGMSGVIATNDLPEPQRKTWLRRALQLAQVLPGTRCVATDYSKLALGPWHFALYWRTSPWDHVAAALFLREAGGHVARLDGSPYTAGDDRCGLLAAASRTIWSDAQRALLTDDAEREAAAASRLSWESFRRSRPSL